jgi:hypothetical protein
MTFLRAAMLGALVLAVASQAVASERDLFVSVLKRFGVTDDVQTSKKPCLCIGGEAAGNMGLVTVYENGGAYVYDCEVPYFDAQGSNNFTRLCMAWGGSFIVLPK